MNRLTTILNSIASKTFTLFNQVIGKSINNSINIDYKTVEFIKITKNIDETDTLATQTKQLSLDQTKAFIGKLNNAKASGLRKMYVLYFFEIKLKNGSKRNFRVNGKYIKENDDYCFDLRDSKFIETIWTES